jgi:uncharacterized membrane protein
MISWATRFRTAEYLRGSLWVVPLLGGVAGAVLGSVEHTVENAVTLPTSWQYSESTASTLLAAIIGAEAALTGFVVTVSVLVIQMATETFSARYMRVWYRDRLQKTVLALLVGTLAFAFALLQRVEGDFVPNLGVTVAGFLVIFNLLVFLVFLDHFVHRLRPVAVAALVGQRGLRAFQDTLGRRNDRRGGTQMPPVAGPPGLVIRADRPGAIQALDVRGLVRWASTHDCLVMLPHSVGDFVPRGVPLITVWGPATRGDADRLRGMVVLGLERTIEQDPAFAIRIMVDVANKALSPAVNDPTTAVQVINYLAEILRAIGSSDLETRAELRDSRGIVRLVVSTPRWEDYLSLAVMEIREYGAESVQVMRRLRAMLEELRDVVRPEHVPAVDEELARLSTTVNRSFVDSVDLDRAGVADRQGVGGPSEEAAIQARGVAGGSDLLATLPGSP